jgi:hypothetical protein
MKVIEIKKFLIFLMKKEEKLIMIYQFIGEMD